MLLFYKVNYCVNIYVFKYVGVFEVVVVNVVGGINFQMMVELLVVLYQIVDYMWGREFIFFDIGNVLYVDFFFFYSEGIWRKLLVFVKSVGIFVYNGGVFVIIQGLRLEMAVEIDCLEKDGCDIVGMIGMLEIVLV